MGFLPPNILPLITQQDLNGLKDSLKHVMLVVPLSTHQWGREKTFEITGSGGKSRVALYDEFLQYFRPQLAEEDAGSQFGLKKLTVPTHDRPDTTKNFVVDTQNYFFQRGIQNSSHEAFGKLKAESYDCNDFLQNQPHRGSCFIKELKKSLELFCSFQAENYKLINAFVAFVAECKGAKNSSLIGIFLPIHPNHALPEGWAEILLDFFYQGKCEGDIIKSLEGNLKTVRGWQDPNCSGKNFREKFAQLANTFRVKLLLQNNPDGDQLSWWYEAGEILGQNDYNGISERFAEARRALTSILEMIPSRSLPQEALAWLLSKLFQTFYPDVDLKKGTEEQWEAVCEGVKKGKKEKDTIIIAEPKNRGLDLVQRTQFKQKLKSGLDLIVEIIANAKDDEKKQALMKQLEETFGKQFYANCVGDSEFQKLVELLIPSDDVRDEERKSLLQGAKAFFKLMIEVRVFPRLFSLPELSIEDLMTRLNGETYGLMVFAFTDANDGDSAALSEKLKSAAETGAAQISETLSSHESSDEKWLKGENNVLTKILNELCQAFGAGANALKETIELFRKAIQLPLHCVGMTDGKVVSSLRHLRPLRPENGEETIDKSHSLTADQAQLINKFTLSRAEVLINLRDAGAVFHQAKGVVEQAEAELNRTNKASTSNKTSKKKEKVYQKSVQNEMTEAVLDGLRKTFDGEKIKFERQKQAAIHMGFEVLEEGRGLGGAEVKDGVLGEVSCPDKGALSVTEMINKSLLDLLKRGNQGSAEVISREVAESFINESEKLKQISKVLKSYEQLNHKIFTLYKVKRSEGNSIYNDFLRQVEATTLGRIIAATGQRCGLEGVGSGLLRMLMDLVRETTEKDGKLSAESMLAKHSLTEYVDAAEIGTGQTMRGLCEDLVHCAEESFQNITGFISELQSIRYLFHEAPTDSKITIFNGDVDTLVPQSLRFFGVGGSSAGRVLPGLVYLSDKAGQIGRLTGLGFRDGLAVTGIIIPPVLRSYTGNAVVPAPNFPLYSVGPDLPLNPEGDSMPTKIPAPFPIMLGFLQCNSGERRPLAEPTVVKTKVKLNLTTPANAAEIANPIKNNQIQRTFCIAQQDCEVEICKFFALSTYGFHSDYYLYVVLRLYAQLCLCAGGAPLGNDMEIQTFGKHWTIASAGSQGTWVALDDSGALEIKSCFPSGSAKHFGFNLNFVTSYHGNVGFQFYRQDDKHRVASDKSWFDTALKRIF